LATPDGFQLQQGGACFCSRGFVGIRRLIPYGVFLADVRPHVAYSCCCFSSCTLLCAWCNLFCRGTEMGVLQHPPFFLLS
jgi:hypothetical protein